MTEDESLEQARECLRTLEGAMRDMNIVSFSVDCATGQITDVQAGTND